MFNAYINTENETDILAVRCSDDPVGIQDAASTHMMVSHLKTALPWP